MPDLGNISLALTSLPDTHLDSGPLNASVKTLVNHCNWDPDLPPPAKSIKPANSRPNSALPHFLPFLLGANKLMTDSIFLQYNVNNIYSPVPLFKVECLLCHSFIYPDEGILCSVRNCEGLYHNRCVKEKLCVSNPRKFKCSQHACFLCNQKCDWRCVRCAIASHDKCAPWRDKIIHFVNQPRQALCWKHPTNWRLDKKHMDLTSDIEEVFNRLPLPYMDEEFKIDLVWKELLVNKLQPPPYVHIRRNVYLIKKKRGAAANDVGCTNCSSACCEDCVCRVQCISCSRACLCPDSCTNRPFRREKKIKIVRTELCGWGVEAAEPINKGDFIVEYTGEVINDAACEERLWDMKYKGVKNFYMCEIGKDFTIDATFKGNSSRFVNHSCDPNCLMEKWQVEGETRVGLFAARGIRVGEPLTYDYRFVQFGSQVKCQCGAANCQGYLGTKRKMERPFFTVCWGAKRRRTSPSSIAAFSTT